MGSCIISEWNTSDKIPEGLYKSKLQDSVQLRGCVERWMNKKLLETKESRTVIWIKESCKTSYWSDDDELENFRIRSNVVERGSVKKERRLSLRRKSERVFLVDDTWTMFQRRFMQLSVMTQQPLITVTKNRDGKGRSDRLLLRPIREQSRLTERDKNPQREQSIERKALQTESAKFHSNSV